MPVPVKVPVLFAHQSEKRGSERVLPPLPPTKQGGFWTFILGFNWAGEELMNLARLERLFQPELGPDWLESWNSCGSPKPISPRLQSRTPSGPCDRQKTEDSSGLKETPALAWPSLDLGHGEAPPWSHSLHIPFGSLKAGSGLAVSSSL